MNKTRVMELIDQKENPLVVMKKAIAAVERCEKRYSALQSLRLYMTDEQFRAVSNELNKAVLEADDDFRLAVEYCRDPRKETRIAA